MHSTLTSTLAKIRDIDRAGWLSDLHYAVSVETAGPRDDLDRFPEARIEVERLARLGHQLLDVPIDDCRKAAAALVLPKTRRRVVLDIIERLHRRLNKAERR